MQRRRAAAAMGLLFTLLLGLPAILTLLPWLTEARAFGIPLGWLVLGFAPFPAMVSLAWWQLRRAEYRE